MCVSFTDPLGSLWGTELLECSSVLALLPHAPPRADEEAAQVLAEGDLYLLCSPLHKPSGIKGSKGND